MPIANSHTGPVNTYPFARVYGSHIASKAIFQLKELSTRDDCKYIIAYPDLHAGNDFPVGYVMKTQNMFYFDVIGADIGCNVLAERPVIEIRKEHDLILGKNITMDKLVEIAEFVKATYTNTRRQISIGGGNHFFEIAVDEQDRIWFIIHSGSRSIGGEAYKKIATELKQLGVVGVPKSSIIGDLLWREFRGAAFHASVNTTSIANKVRPMFSERRVISGEKICTMHNIIVDRKDGIYHYKGASAVYDPGDKVIIPLNMRDGSLIVSVLKPKELFYGINHGAGRRLSRKQAKAQLSAEDLEGINVLSAGDIIDEAPAAYKDIIPDMEQMEEMGLIKIENRLKALITVKE